MVLALSIVPGIYSHGADSTKSLVLKNFAPERNPFRLQENNSAEVLWDAFMTMKKANSGDPVAQHELGLRYLIGKDFSPDTVKAAYWIGKAADQHLITAEYNFGLLLNNGWGVPWNPFEAYKHFEYAAVRGLVEAECVYGLFRTDNLVVERNYDEAYRWIKMAADSGFSPAKEVLKEFAAKGIMTKINLRTDESQNTRQSAQSNIPQYQKPALQPIFLDFKDDSIPDPDNKTLLKEIVNEVGNRYKLISDSLMSFISFGTHDRNTLQSLYDAGEAESPEALTMLGRLYEQGIGVKMNLIQASVYYLRAMRFDSPWSPMLLWSIVRKEDYFRQLNDRVDSGDPAAKFVWSGLIDIGFDHQLTETQALKLLENASQQGYREAIVQLAVCYYTGHWVKQDREKAIELLLHAEQLGSRDAKVRVYAIRLKNSEHTEKVNDIIKMLREFILDGSILAQSTLGYCYEKGIGVKPNKAESIRLYREAAQRGSRAAYDALRKSYDDIRPNDAEFRVEE
jgi:TPR repeat protein